MGLSFNTINSIINKLVELAIIKKQEDAKRNKLYIYEEYIQLFNKVNELV